MQMCIVEELLSNRADVNLKCMRLIVIKINMMMPRIMLW